MLYRPIIPSLLLALSLSGCSQAPDSPAFTVSDSQPAYNQTTFHDYINDTREWLSHNRAFITQNKRLELDSNSPFELAPVKNNPSDKTAPTKGILLVHGLGDSPYSFVDIAPLLAQQGFLVRTILLPGHGSKPADLIQVTMEDWEDAVSHHADLMALEVDQLWLGGFSTGANLVTSWATQQKADTVKGMLLFSPGYKPKSSLVALSPALSYFKDWADIDLANNYVRYDSLAVNGAGEYYKTSKTVRSDLNINPVTFPVLMTISENDSVIDAENVLSLFETQFTHPDSQLIWYGTAPDTKDSRVSVLESSIPEFNISNFSHMNALFAPDNDYYGQNGSYRMCDNGQTLQANEQCPTAKTVWYSAWGYREENKIHARLTWNPYFAELEKSIKTITE
ncbi:esterase [Endozoicomonas montiporae]|uniref:Esterase n=2 Tax=Endozoicomonas montiporae TaxID=1027273 RepID=A0A081N8Y3_9GAMM|nr:alpha/beta fold hydrolase [Endozoicomonas montiporae]AMO55169.1 lipoprotein [Endozoicomonas montiporae CL-33]KEQ14906.1 esterase [Endozoicomonas montiporae]